MSSFSQALRHALNRNIIFVHGKGGVGKTAVSRAIALTLSKEPAQSSSSPVRKVLWVTLESPILEPQQVRQISPNLWEFNCDFQESFEEYAAIKIGIPKLTQLFLKNKLMKSLSRAAPGLRELVLLGKVWFERDNYTHLVVDLPSTGYGLAMFQSTQNFARLFKGGPLNRDAEAMLETFRSSKLCTHLIVALPEEMPLQESIELQGHLKNILPNNPAHFLVNRLFPKVPVDPKDQAEDPAHWSSPLAKSDTDYCQKRYLLERHNLRTWKDGSLLYAELEFVPPKPQGTLEQLVEALSLQFKQKAYL